MSRAGLVWPLDEGALEGLHWYLEDYLRAPLGAWEEAGPPDPGAAGRVGAHEHSRTGLAATTPRRPRK